MKFTINVDCTPVEARQLLGLPDVEPIQKAVLAEMERRMMVEMERFSPEGMLKTWFAAVPASQEMMRDMFGRFFNRAGGGGGAGGGETRK